jgi:hypothetical protein
MNRQSKNRLNRENLSYPGAIIHHARRRCIGVVVMRVASRHAIDFNAVLSLLPHMCRTQAPARPLRDARQFGALGIFCPPGY